MLNRKNSKSIDYIKQNKKHNTCVPVAVVNAGRWTGIPLSFSHLPKLRKAFKSDRVGTQLSNIERPLRRVFKRKLNIRKYIRPSLVTMDRILNQPSSAVILVYPFEENKEIKYHCTFIPKKQGHRYICINDSEERLVSSRTKNKISYYLKRKRGNGPALYALRKI